MAPEDHIPFTALIRVLWPVLEGLFIYSPGLSLDHKG